MSKYVNYDAIDYRHCEIFDKSEDFHNGVLHMAKRIEEAPSIDLEITDDGTLIVKLPDATKVSRVFVQDEKYGDLYYTDGSAEGFDKEYVLSELSDLLDEYSELDENGLHDPKWCGVKEAYGVVKTAPPADRPSAVYTYLKNEIGDIVDSETEFDEWFKRMVWHVEECNRLADRPQEWIPCSERLPKAEEKVWIQTERGKVCFAMYEDGTISEDDSAWNWYDLPFDKWDEENDCGIIPEGWWEWTEFHPDTEFDCPIDEVVVAWMSLPELMKGADDEEISKR